MASTNQKPPRQRADVNVHYLLKWLRQGEGNAVSQSKHHSNLRKGVEQVPDLPDANKVDNTRITLMWPVTAKINSSYSDISTK